MNNFGIKDIAHLAGVSIGTVDRVLHNRRGVSEPTKEKVLKIIKETGYKKNVIASRLKLAAVKKIKIALLIPEIKNKWSYWKLPQKGIKKAVGELKEQGISVKYFYFNFLHPHSFTTACTSIFEQRYDAIITVPFLEAESNDLLQRAKERKKPVVFLDTERSLNHAANYIRQNSSNAGMVAGRLLHGLVGNDGLYFVVNIQNETGIQINNQQREYGFREFFKKNFPNQTLIIHTINHPLEDRIEIAPEIQALFSSSKKKGIFVTNARSFLLPKILIDNNIQQTSIVGFDLNRQNLAYLKSGAINFLINQKPEYQGYAAIKGLYKFLTERDNTDLNIDIPIEIVVKENAFF